LIASSSSDGAVPSFFRAQACGADLHARHRTTLPRYIDSCAGSTILGRASVWTLRMDDPFELVSAMFVIALSAVVLVGGQLYLAKQTEPNSGTSASRPSLAENATPMR